MATYEIDSLSDTDSIHDLTFQTLDDGPSILLDSDPPSLHDSSLIFDLTQDLHPQVKGKNRADEAHAGTSIDNSIPIDDDIYPFFVEAGIEASEGLRMLGMDADILYSKSSLPRKRINETETEESSNKRSQPIEIIDDEEEDETCFIDLTEEDEYELIDLESEGPIASSSTAQIIGTSASRLNWNSLQSRYRTSSPRTPVVPAQGVQPKRSLSNEEAEKELRSLLDNITNDNPLPKDRTMTPERMSIVLLEHQKIGLQWMLKMENSNNKGGILADDMGLGKTVQALSVICQHPRENITPTDLINRPVQAAGHFNLKATLIVCPVSLIDQWKREVESKTNPSLSVYIYHGPHRTVDPQGFLPYDVVITSYVVAAADFTDSRKGPLSKVRFHRIVLDEAHTIKNKNTKAAQACYSLDATYRWCMTATPIQNKIEELYSLIKFLRIHPFCDWDEFRDTIVRPMKSGNHVKAIRASHVLMKAISLRRSKRAIIDGRPILNLPQRNIHMTHIDFSQKERAHYNAINSRAQARFSKYLRDGTVMRNYSSVLVMLLRLRQACLHPELTPQDDIDASQLNDQGNRSELARQMKPNVVQRLLSSTLKEVECPICMDIAQDAQILVQCGHILCKECFDNYWNSAYGHVKRCPHCRGPMDRQKVVDTESFLKVHAPELLRDVTPEEDVALASFVSSAKVDKTLEILDSTARETNYQDKTIIFSQFTTMLDLLELPLEDKGHNHLRYDGSMSVCQRSEVVKKFFDDPTIHVLLVSTKCGSLGLNLTCANRVILLDVWWNPSMENQAIDRVHRIGQTKPVEVHRIFIKDTVEDRILDLQKRKQNITDGVLGEGSSMSSARLDLNELTYLFRGDHLNQMSPR